MGQDKVNEHKKVRVISEENRMLFDRYITPNMDIIRNLVIHYTNDYQDVDDNFQYVLREFAKGISTYDSSKSLKTWIHVCVKRSCFRLNGRKSTLNKNRTGVPLDSVSASGHAPSVGFDEGNLSFMDSISDEMYDALMQIPPVKLSPFLLQAQGYSIKEITKMEVESGNLAEYSEYTVKSRIFWARNRLKEIMSQYGYH